MRKVALAGLVVLAAACGGAKDRTGAKLELADATMIVEQSDGQLKILALAANGVVTFDNQPLVTLEKNGHILVDGKRVARVERDGTISVNTVKTNALVKEDGTFVLDGVEELSIGADGKVIGPLRDTMDHPRLKLDGGMFRYDGPPGARRATMVGFAALVTNLPAAAATK